MQKKRFLKFFLCLLSFFIISGLLIWNNKRYEVSFPIEDYEYKKNIISSSCNFKYKLENLAPLVGPSELASFIAKNDENSEIYIPSKNNIKQGIYRANLHMHTTNSDGLASVKFLLDYAEEYAKKNLKGKPMYIAITDHNTVLGSKELIKVLQENPKKYKNIKVIAGMEIHTAYKTKLANENIEIHVLLWCINPYDKFLNKEFYKKNLNDKWNRIYPDRDFNTVIHTMSKYGLVGIAHPARYLEVLGTKKEKYIQELLEQYKQSSQNKVFFIEGYYQSYKLILEPFNDYKHLLNYINEQAKKLGICRTGSTDVHGYSIFKK